MIIIHTQKIGMLNSDWPHTARKEINVASLFTNFLFTADALDLMTDINRHEDLERRTKILFLRTT